MSFSLLSAEIILMSSTSSKLRAVVTGTKVLNERIFRECESSWKSMRIMVKNRYRVKVSTDKMSWELGKKSIV